MNNLLLGLHELFKSRTLFSQAGALGWHDVRQRYRRTVLGPFWLTISTAILILTMGLVFTHVYNSKAAEYIPFLAVSLILWGFFSTVINEGCELFISSESIIKQLPISLLMYLYRMMWRNVVIFGHNIIILPFIAFIFGIQPNIFILFAIPGLILMILNLSWICIVLAIVCSRYRDLIRIVSSLLQILVYVTPIMWMPSFLPANIQVYLVQSNPLFHIFDIVRSPLLGQVPATLSWIVSLSCCVFGWIFALILFGKYKNKIVFWI